MNAPPNEGVWGESFPPAAGGVFLPASQVPGVIETPLALATRALDVLLAPLAAAPGWVGPAALGALAGLFAALGLAVLVHWPSLGQSLRLARSRGSRARGLAFVLINMLPALLVLVPLLLFLYGQCEARFAQRPLRTGESVVVALRAAPRAVFPAECRLEAGPDLEIETPALRLRDENRILWRVRATTPGLCELRFRLPEGMVLTKSLAVNERGAGVSARRVLPASPGSIATRLACPLEAPLPVDAGVESLDVAYPPAKPGWPRATAFWWPTLLLAGLGALLGSGGARHPRARLATHRRAASSHAQPRTKRAAS